jgi:hypothetical protein
MLALSEKERVKKLNKLTLDQKVSVLKATAVDQITKSWCDESVSITKQVVDSGAIVTEAGTPDLLKLFGGSIAYLTLLERGTAEMMRNELTVQDKGSQLLTSKVTAFEAKINQLKSELAEASELMEDWLSLRLIRREMRLNVDADGSVTDVSSFEDNKIEQPRLVNKEQTDD